MFDIGRVCIKIAGRDAGKRCVVVEILDERHVMIDGLTRRRRCNKIHLEPLDQKLDISSKASHEQVINAFKNIDIEIKDKKPKQKTEKPKAAARGKPKEKAGTSKKDKKSKTKSEKTKKE
ncbi:MAG: 50S ribosomal protein L14e [Candidatus Woesearchaeota archaeon]